VRLDAGDAEGEGAATDDVPGIGVEFADDDGNAWL